MSSIVFITRRCNWILNKNELHTYLFLIVKQAYNLILRESYRRICLFKNLGVF